MDHFGQVFEGNASEPIDQLEIFEAAALAPAYATPLPEVGIAAVLGPNETHTYTIDMHKVNFSLSLSECSRQPPGEQPLLLNSGNFSGSTKNGGLLNIQNTTLLNDTIVVTSPVSTNINARWQYQLGVDRSASYIADKPALYWVDSDFSNSLFVTMDYKNMSIGLQGTPFSDFVNFSNLNATTRNFNLFLRNVNDSALVQLPGIDSDDSDDDDSPRLSFSPLDSSYCAMQATSLLNENNCDFSTTSRGANRSGIVDKGQFLFKGLNRSTYYSIQLAIPPPPGQTLGGLLFPIVSFRTKESTSCQLIYNMSICPNTAFSVPGNALRFTTNELTSLYEDYVAAFYKNFTQALDQINCHAKREDRFSVYSSCADCASAYQDWLCTVAVPRCADWSSNASYLAERLPNTSRNSMINEVIKPDKYKEILPCYWLCNNLATYCPVSLGFTCPSGNMLNLSYGFPNSDGDISCSYPGAVYLPDKAWMAGPPWLIMLACLLVAFL